MIALLTATGREMKAALAFFGETVRLEQGETQVRTVAGMELILGVTGIGPVNAGIAAGRLLATQKIAGVVNAGIAGAFAGSGLALGTVCAVETEIQTEFGLLNNEGLADAKALGFAMGRTADGPVWDRLQLDPERAAKSLGLTLPRSYCRATSLTVGCVSATPERAALLEKTYSPQLENMEGFSLAWACAQAGVPFLEVRSVSNVVGSRREEDWDINRAMGALGDACRALLA